jgi:hypothetical protein
MKESIDTYTLEDLFIQENPVVYFKKMKLSPDLWNMTKALYKEMLEGRTLSRSPTSNDVCNLVAILIFVFIIFCLDCKYAAHVCKVTLKQLSQPIRSHTKSFGTLGKLLEIPPFYANIA